ncbi:F-box only protein 7 [Brachionichthys hirsutus]|uniref:F-box only protein 7 n=1 Tax=Brachionichthys hirsutus TaxID=412623 RepID=UPI003604ED90
MKLRIRILRQTRWVDFLGEESTLKELRDRIRGTVLSSVGLSAETEFTLSLNGSEPLSGAARSLSSLGVVSGDLICVILTPHSGSASINSTDATKSSSTEHNLQGAALTSNRRALGCSEFQSSSSSSAVSPVPLGASPVPLAASPVPLGASPVPLGASPVPLGASPVPLAASPVPLGASPVPPVSSWEPLLCCEAEDGHAPLSLELLYHSAQITCPIEAMMVAGNLLMLETGFIPQGFEFQAAEMPAGWRVAAGAYKLYYSHPLCGDGVVVVVGVAMGPLVAFSGLLEVNGTFDTVRTLSLRPSSYVTDEWPGESAAAAFRGLGRLSRVFKDQLAYPLIAAARDAMGLPVFGLAVLPPELLLRVLSLLDVSSVGRLSSVSRHFYAATADSMLWRHLFRRDFTDPEGSRARDTDWKEVYKRFQKRLVYLRRPRHFSLPRIHPSPRDIIYPAPPCTLVPGIIGGEYDHRPHLPRPRYDPIGLPGDPDRRPPTDVLRVQRTAGRPADVRRGFI